MPGIEYAESQGGQTPSPTVMPYLAANSMSGTGTPPANALQAGDLVALTTASALTGSSQVVVRMLLAADKTAVYKEGTPVAGILGVAMDSISTNATGIAGAPPPLGAVTSGAAIAYPLSGSAMIGTDGVTTRSQVRVMVFRPGRIFRGRLYTGGGSVTLTNQYNNTLGGFTLATTSGVTTFTINVTDTGTSACVRILGPDTADPLYGTLVAQNAAGPFVLFEVLESFSQSLTGINYSTQ